MARAALQADRHEYGSYDELLEDYFERGWTDGLPIVAPTPEKVAAFLDAAGLEASEVIGEVPTREVVVTAEQAAATSLRAKKVLGCSICTCRAGRAESVGCASRMYTQ